MEFKLAAIQVLQQLYHWDPWLPSDIPRLLARIVKEDDSVTLDISLAAIEMKLMEACVVATVLFQSGRRID